MFRYPLNLLNKFQIIGSARSRLLKGVTIVGAFHGSKLTVSHYAPTLPFKCLALLVLWYCDKILLKLSPTKFKANNNNSKYISSLQKMKQANLYSVNC